MGRNKNNSVRKRVTLKDIALKTGYTINTVSRALKNKDDISVSTRKLIQEAAKEMGYISDAVASSLRSGVTKTIAIILADTSNPHFSILIREIEMTVRDHGYTTIILNTQDDDKLEQEAIYTAISKRVDGIILCPAQHNKKNIHLIQRAGTPFVLMGRRFEDMDVDYVISDDEKGGYLATKHLIETGHKDIMCLIGPLRLSSSVERLSGYKRALQENGIVYQEELVKEIDVITGYRKVLRSIIEKGKTFSGVFAFNDMIAWEFIYLLKKHKISVPESISVVGFDNIQSRIFFPFGLSSISNSKGKMSSRAAKILLGKMSRKEEDKPYREIIDTKLVIRESSDVNFIYDHLDTLE